MISTPDLRRLPSLFYTALQRLASSSYQQAQYPSTDRNIGHQVWDSAYLRQGMSYQCRHLANQYGWMSVNHFPYLPIVTKPENNPCIQMIRIATKITAFVHWPNCQPSLKISCKFFRKFLRKVINRHTNKQRRLHILVGGGNWSVQSSVTSLCLLVNFPTFNVLCNEK